MKRMEVWLITKRTDKDRLENFPYNRVLASREGDHLVARWLRGVCDRRIQVYTGR
jgi:hypothetical protein